MYVNWVKVDCVEFILWDIKYNFYFNELWGGVVDDVFKFDNDFIYFLICMLLGYFKKFEEFYNFILF